MGDGYRTAPYYVLLGWPEMTGQVARHKGRTTTYGSRQAYRWIFPDDGKGEQAEYSGWRKKERVYG